MGLECVATVASNAVAVANEMLWNANTSNDDKGVCRSGSVTSNVNVNALVSQGKTGGPRDMQVGKYVQSYAVQMALTIYTQPSHQGSKTETRQKWYIP